MTLSSRRGSLPERVRKLNTEATNLKTSQFTGWDSIRCYKTETSKAWDLELNLDGTTPANGDVTLLTKFIADHQDAPFAKMTIEVLVNNTSTYRVGRTERSETYDYGIATNGTVPDVFGNYSPTRTPNKKNEVSWYDYIQVSAGMKNIKVKIRVFATDTGKIQAGYELSYGNTVMYI